MPILFDLVFPYSYVSSYFTPYLGVSRDSLSSFFYVSSLVEDFLGVDRIYRPCLVTIRGFETSTDLLLLIMVGFDSILGINWLSSYYAILDCHAKTVILAMLGISRIEWSGSLDHTHSRVTSSLKAQSMVKRGCAA